MMPINLPHLKQWVGKQETAQDQIYPTPVQAMALSLNHDAASILKAPLRPVWHWLYFLPMSPLSEAGPDGHPARGGFLPPVPLPRRMWASSELSFHEPIAIGDTLKRTSTIESVDHKQGRSGDLVFVTVNHQVHRGHTLCIDEKHHIVYREMPAPEAQIPTPPAAPTGAQWSRSVTPDPVLLFRYSALTFNSHRIHYDAPYTQEVEGYPGLVVHGPLVATLLLDLLHEHVPAATVKNYEFRAVSPTFCPDSFTLNGRVEEDGHTVTLWAEHQGGGLIMRAQATI
ncbi:MAG TPA: MaoC family dehydratase N-terminal domain-containing protein [Paenalcaligenes sp.]|nr:MaoC family dehydratase N-terminal domain-containing protein [Paenalcaligenes sp.]